MGCSNKEKIKVDEPDNKNKNKDKKSNKKAKQNKNDDDNNNEEEEYEFSEEEEEIEDVGDHDNIEKLKKKHMIKEYYFYPTKDIPKNKFVRKNTDKMLPSDFASKEVDKKDKQYFCFQKNEKQKKHPKNKFIPDDEESKKNNIIEDEIYLFNQKIKQIKSFRPLKKEEILKPYNYQIEYDVNEDGIIDKKSNKEKTKYEYLDMFPNGEGYKYVNSDEEEEKKEEEKTKIKLPKKEIDEKKIEEIKKNDENDIANIINKELKENGLLENNQKVVENANDF